MSDEQKPKLGVRIAAYSQVAARFLTPVAIVCAIALVVIEPRKERRKLHVDVSTRNLKSGGLYPL